MSNFATFNVGEGASKRSGLEPPPLPKKKPKKRKAAKKKGRK